MFLSFMRCPYLILMGPQFAHIQTFARKENPAGQSIDQVLGEAGRDPEYSPHVENPAPPVILYGVDLDELRHRHDQMIDAAATEVKTKKGIRRRSIRVDRHTLMTVVASYPLTYEQIGDDQEELERLEAWKALNINHLRQLFGDGLQTVLEHTDESHPHIHAYALPLDQKGVDAKQLHPGLVAKAAADAEAREDGAEPREAVRAGDKAYVTAMRLWQDQYHQMVGAPSGLTRDGPKRARKSRRQWQQEKAAARAQADLMTAQAAEEALIEAKRRDLIQARWDDRRASRARAAKLDGREAIMDEFRLKARSAANKIKAGRVAVDQDRASIESEREALAEERQELEELRVKLETREVEINRVVKRIHEVVVKFVAYFGLPFPKRLGAALDALEREVAARTQRFEPKEPEETDNNNTGPSFGM